MATDRQKSRQRRSLPLNAAVVLVALSAIVSLIFALTPDLLSRIAHEAASLSYIFPNALAITASIVAVAVAFSALRLLIVRTHERQDELRLLHEVAAIQGKLAVRSDRVRIVEAATATEVRDQKVRTYLTSHLSEIVGVEPGSLGASYFVLSEFERNRGNEKMATRYHRQFEAYLPNGSGSAVSSNQSELSSTSKKLDAFRRYYLRQLECCRRQKLRQGEAIAHCALGHVAFAKGELQQAKQHYTTCLAIWHGLSNQVEQIPCLFQLARVAEAVQDYASAEQLYQEGLKFAVPTGNDLEIAAFLLMLGQLMVVTSQLPQGSSRPKARHLYLQRQRRLKQGKEMLFEAAARYKSASPAHLSYAKAKARSLGVRVGR